MGSEDTRRDEREVNQVYGRSKEVSPPRVHPGLRKDRPYRVMVARFPGDRGWEHSESSGWLMKTLLDMADDPRITRAGLMPIKLADTPITMTRNLAIRTALEGHADYVLMIDSDMFPDHGGDELARPFWPTAWEWMMARRQQEMDLYGTDETEGPTGPHVTRLAPCTIAAPYCGPSPDECVYVFEWRKTSNGHIPQYSLGMFSRETAALRTGIEEVAALPTGLILYDVRQFRKLPPPWFQYEWTDEFQTKKASTEDVFQTRNASLAGFPQYVAWDCWAAHIKQSRIGKPTKTAIADVRSVFVQGIVANLKPGERVAYLGNNIELEQIRGMRHAGQVVELKTDNPKEPKPVATRNENFGTLIHHEIVVKDSASGEVMRGHTQKKEMTKGKLPEPEGVVANDLMTFGDMADAQVVKPDAPVQSRLDILEARLQSLPHVNASATSGSSEDASPKPPRRSFLQERGPADKK